MSDNVRASLMRRLERYRIQLVHRWGARGYLHEILRVEGIYAPR